MSDVKDAYYGIYQGTVTNIEDPEKRGRIKLTIPDVTGDKESAWCDPMSPVAYDNGGDFCIPSLKETVWVMFISGDPNRPVWLGGWWSKEKSPLGNQYSGVDSIRIINYSNCSITMKDGVIDINVGDGVCDLKIQHNQVTVKGNLNIEGNVTVNGATVLDSTLSVGGSTTAHAISSGAITASSVKSNSSVTASGNMSAGGSISADGNISSESNVSGATLSAVSNVEAGNNVTAGNFVNATYVTADVVTGNTKVQSNGKDLATHTHPVTFGAQGTTGNTDAPS